MKPNVFLYSFFIIIEICDIAPSLILGKILLEKTPLKDGVELKIFICISSSFPFNSSFTNTFTTEEITGFTNEAAKVASKASRNRLSCFFASCFTFSVTPSIDTPESCNDFIILIISFISLCKRNKVDSFPALTAPFPLIFLSNLFIAFEAKFSPGKIISS